MVSLPTHSNIASYAHRIHQSYRRPDGPTAPEPQRVANFCANEPGHPHPDRHARQTRLVPTRLIRAVLRAEVHEVRFEITAAPLAGPHSEHVADVGFGLRVCDVEDVVFL